MKCEDLQLNLPIYTDDILKDDERAAVEAHLSVCPVCRQKLADFQILRNNLRSLARPEIPAQVLNSVKISVAAQLQKSSTLSSPSYNYREWFLMRVMPYGVGVVASLILGFTLLWSLLLPVNQIGNNDEFSQSGSFSQSSVLIANANAKNNNPVNYELSPFEFAQTRLAVSGESPSVNPQGALIALTKSLMRGNMKDEEVVVVADVFGDGLAQIAEVVEPSRDRHAVYELEKALKTDSAYAPFVPANLDRRSDSVRVVFKIQSVNVETNLKSTNQ